MLSKVGGRKAFIAMVVLISGVAIDLATERGLSANLMYLMMALLGTFSITNVASKHVVGKQSMPPVSDNSELEGRVKQVEQYASGLHNVVEQMQKQQELTNKRIAAIIGKND